MKGKPTRAAAPRPLETRRPARRARAAAPLPLIAYGVGQGVAPPLAQAPPARAWMEATDRRFAYRCLPMVIANQAGWLVANPVRITATWSGGAGLGALDIRYPTGREPRHATSHFGSGILTFSIGYLFRTPPGYNLLVRGPANWPKDGISPLEGIVETDWSDATFTMNWQLTRPGHPVVFDEGEPIAMLVPVRRGELERFRPEIRAIAEAPALKRGYEAWRLSRNRHIAELKKPDSPARKQGWQRHYMRGTSVADERAPEHQTSLSLSPFLDRRR